MKSTRANSECPQRWLELLFRNGIGGSSRSALSASAAVRFVEPRHQIDRAQIRNSALACRKHLVTSTEFWAASPTGSPCVVRHDLIVAVRRAFTCSAPIDASNRTMSALSFSIWRSRERHRCRRSDDATH